MHMKKLILMGIIALVAGTLPARAQMPNPNVPIIRQSDRPVYNPYQFPNYYQNNSSYTNNSMQNNKPATPRSGPYTGNGSYIDPTRDFNTPLIYGNTTNPAAGTGTQNANNSTIQQNTETNKK